MQNNSYAIGATVRCTAEFRDIANLPYDPGAVNFELRLPDGSLVTNIAAVKDSVGNYHADVIVAISGTHYYRFAGTGTGAAASEQSFAGIFSHVLNE